MEIKIEDWAMYKDWSALTQAEQLQVLTKMTCEEYRHLHQVMRGIKALDAEIQPPAHLRAQLEQHLLLQHKNNGLQMWWQRKIPVWQAAAGIILGILSTFWMGKSESTVIVPKVVQVRDTLLQERIVWKNQVVEKIKVIYRDRDSTQVITDSPKGISLEDAPELLGLFTQAEK